MPVVATSVADQPNGPNIVEIVARHTKLYPLGGDGGQLGATCPFCGSRAFRVRPPQDTFHCFGCGDGGDGLRFLAMIDRRGQT